MCEVVFTEEQKKLIERRLKVHGKQMSFDRKHEAFWELFEKSATRDLLEEFNRAAGVSRIRIERTKKAETRNVKEEIDRINIYDVKKLTGNEIDREKDDDDERGDRQEEKRRRKE